MFGPSDLRLLGAEHWLGPGIPEELFTPPEPGTREVADAVALLEMTRYMRNQLLRDTDAMSMAHSLEVRVPLLDDRVVDVAVSVPAAIRNRPGKGLLQAAAGLRRTDEKRGFTLPFDAWMRGPLRDPVRDLLLSEDYPLPWLTAADARRHLWDAFESRRVHWSRPWTIAVLRLWAAEHGLRW
jgi:asparagine synthase (glutamine-hydrolysing)